MKSLSIFILFPLFAACLQPEQTPLTSETHTINDVDWKLDLSTGDTLLDLHRRLVEIESITENEKKVAKWLASYLEKQNLTVELQEVGTDRFNVFAYPGEERKTEILVTSHIDTVISPSKCQFLGAHGIRFHHICHTNSKLTPLRFGAEGQLMRKPV